MIPKSVYSEGMIDQTRSESNFLALNVLFNQLDSKKKLQILDMGSACGENIDFFSSLRCKIFIEDFYHTLKQQFGERKLESLNSTELNELLLDYDKAHPFDVILMWDLFDYMPPELIKSLMEHISQYCRDGSMLFFVTSGLGKIPAQPAQFKIQDRQHLRYVNNSPTTRESFGYKQSTYKTLLPGFKLFRGFRMSSGMEENLFVYGA